MPKELDAYDLIQIGQKLTTDIAILTADINDLSDNPRARFTLNRKIEEKKLLEAELRGVKLKFQEVV